MINILYSVLCLLMAIMVLKTQVCLHYGRAIASPEYLEFDSNGYQGALTNPSGNKWFFLTAALMAGFIVYYFTVSWLFGVFAIVNFFLMMVVANIFYPKPSSPRHLSKLISEMNNRKAGYLKKGDQLRADAVDELLEKLVALQAGSK
jgi:hypothetical protein